MCAAALFFMMTGGANAMLPSPKAMSSQLREPVDGQLRLLTARIPARLRHLSSI